MLSIERDINDQCLPCRIRELEDVSAELSSLFLYRRCMGPNEVLEQCKNFLQESNLRGFHERIKLLKLYSLLQVYPHHSSVQEIVEMLQRYEHLCTSDQWLRSKLCTVFSQGFNKATKISDAKAWMPLCRFIDYDWLNKRAVQKLRMLIRRSIHDATGIPKFHEIMLEMDSFGFIDEKDYERLSKKLNEYIKDNSREVRRFSREIKEIQQKLQKYRNVLPEMKKFKEFVVEEIKDQIGNEIEARVVNKAVAEHKFEDKAVNKIAEDYKFVEKTPKKCENGYIEYPVLTMVEASSLETELKFFKSHKHATALLNYGDFEKVNAGSGCCLRIKAIDYARTLTEELQIRAKYMRFFTLEEFQNALTNLEDVYNFLRAAKIDMKGITTDHFVVTLAGEIKLSRIDIFSKMRGGKQDNNVEGKIMYLLGNPNKIPFTTYEGTRR